MKYEGHSHRYVPVPVGIILYGTVFKLCSPLAVLGWRIQSQLKNAVSEVDSFHTKLTKGSNPE